MFCWSAYLAFVNPEIVVGSGRLRILENDMINALHSNALMPAAPDLRLQQLPTSDGDEDVTPVLPPVGHDFKHYRSLCHKK